MHNDDLPVGRILDRREILTIFGASTVAVLVGCMPIRELGRMGRGGPGGRGEPGSPGGVGGSAAAPETTSMCIVSPEQTEGPYFSDVQLNRSDIRSDPSDGAVSAGIPLVLTLNVNRVTADTCEPFPNAIVDIWHCDADGVYSDFAGENSAGQKFLRGYQVTDENGVAQFMTIYPGWYRGRTVHIHLKIRSEDEAGQGYEFTSQMYFDDNMTDQVYSQAPYSARPNRTTRTTRNSNDGIYNSGGEQMIVNVSEIDEGYAGVLNIGMFVG